MLIYILLLKFSNSKKAEVVELVYGTSLENWRAFIAYRGFESHPLRQIRKEYKTMNLYCYRFKFYILFINLEMYPSGEGDCLLNS